MDTTLDQTEISLGGLSGTQTESGFRVDPDRAQSPDPGSHGSRPGEEVGPRWVQAPPPETSRQRLNSTPVPSKLPVPLVKEPSSFLQNRIRGSVL